VFLKTITLFALEGFPMIKTGDDIARITVETCRRNHLSLQDGDVIVAAQKIFSKAEGRVVRITDVVPSAKAKEIAEKTGKDPKFVELVLSETRKVLKATDEIFLVEDKRGLICINAGIDKSNIRGKENFALLPESPDRSAYECRLKMEKSTGKKLAVVICDTYSRPFRRGQTNFAIGFSGLNPFRDYRGKADLFGHILKVKNVAVVDEVAAAAELLMGQGTEAVPIVIIRGLEDSVEPRESGSIGELEISEDEDLFKGVL
jgi:coenzyme F420-0:L-glutamate ligase/coenzyme F420-1:gamma-L-glutamate ligase